MSTQRSYAADGDQFRAVVEHLDEDGNVAHTRFLGPYSTLRAARAKVTENTHRPNSRGRAEQGFVTWVARP